MRCKSCRGEIRFVEGAWEHTAKSKCARVVVEWPSPLIDEEDAA